MNRAEDDDALPVESTAQTGDSSVYPLFPLPDVILFPGQVIPLHIFEERYRQMVRDLLDSSGELILGTVLGADKDLLSGIAPVQSVAGIGRLQQYQTLEDGRFLVMIQGERRVRVAPHLGSLPYPQARIEEIDGEETRLPVEMGFWLLEAIQRCSNEVDIPTGVSVVQLSDILTMLTPMSSEERYQLFANPSLEDRIDKVLAMQTTSGENHSEDS